jgi:uncharacterized membrane protein
MPNNDFNTGVIKPVECMKEGWELIKNDYWLFFAITIVGLLIGGAVPIVLIGPMLCGVYYCFLKKRDGVTPEFGDVFKGFDYFLPALIATLIMAGIFFVAAFIFIVIPYLLLVLTLVGSRGKPSPVFTFIFIAFFCLMMFIFAIFAACVHALIVFTHLLIIDRGLSAWEAIKLSAKASWANLGGVVGFIVVQFLLSLAGMLALIVGAYLVLPIIYAGTTVMYRKIFPPLERTPNMTVPPSPANYQDAGYGGQ